MMASDFLTRSTRPLAKLSTTDHLSMSLDRTNRLSVLDSMHEETLVVDIRSEMSPSQSVENRLTQKLGAGMLPISQLQMRTILRGR